MGQKRPKLCGCSRCHRCACEIKPAKRCQCNKMNRFSAIDFFFSAFNTRFNTGNYPCRCNRRVCGTCKRK